MREVVVDNKNKLNHSFSSERAEYAVIGAGPAGIFAIANLLHRGISGDKILWIDPAFRVGDFGGVLSKGSSVPGNTKVEIYQNINRAIYRMIPVCASLERFNFQINQLSNHEECALKIAAQPLQTISDRLKAVVCSIWGELLEISNMKLGIKLNIKGSNGKNISRLSRRVILAVGAQAKTLSLPYVSSSLIIIPSNVAFVKSELEGYLKQYSGIKTAAVIGSSHSAALATMHLLESGIYVNQFMNKDYLYAASSVTPDGIPYTRYDNTGLKGDVARFTKSLSSTGNQFAQQLTYYRAEDKMQLQMLLRENIENCEAAVVAAGYEARSTLQVNNSPLSKYKHDSKTTEFEGVSGLFGIGIAFPERVRTLSGEVEFAVGVGKFWKTTSDPNILSIWEKGAAV